MIGAVDIGGTKLAVGLVDESGKVLAKNEIVTGPDSSYSAGLEKIAGMFREMERYTRVEITGIGIGSTGPVDPLTGAIIIDPTCVQPEQLELILKTMNANAFNFIVKDLGPGVHTIAVQARINLAASAQAGSSTARGLIGNGSMTVEEVRLIQTPNIELP